MELGYSSMDLPRKVNYRSGLFDPSNLSSSTQIDSALLEFGAVLNRTNYPDVLKDLLEKKNIVVLVLSGIHEELVPLKKWILDDFPPTPNNFEKSFAYELLRELCAFFLFYSISADAETEMLLHRHNSYVERGIEVLKILLNMSFVEEQASPPPSPTRKRAKGSQREQKQLRKQSRECSSVDLKPFMALDLTVPKERSEADSLCQALWFEMRGILDVLLSGIRRPEVIDVVRALFILQERPEERTIPAQSAVVVEEDVSPSPPPQSAEEDPFLYPISQSMNAAFHFDSPVDFGKWRILLGSQAQRDLRYWHRRDDKIFHIIMKKLRELSEGFFSNDNQKRLCGPYTSVPVFEAKMTRDLRLVYSVDCIANHDNESEIQVLRVFGIFTHAQMDYRLWECVSHFLGSHNKEYRERCIARRLHVDGGKTYLPLSFPESFETGQAEEAFQFIPSLPNDDADKLHKVISLEKYVILSKGLLESIESGKEANFPFEVSKNERSIIENPYSCYVLGRSGTGKTTTMLFKMLLVEHDQSSNKFRRRPRQVFVTRSRVLVGKVEELFMTFLSSLAFASSVDEPVARATNTSEDDFFNEDDNIEWRNDLPVKFSELEDKNFPLFVTFDKLCTMIEADIEATSSTKSVDSVLELFGTARLARRKGQLVTFDRFLAEYWPRFEQTCFHALLIFNEIMGVIVGSEGSLLSPNGCLDRETYINLSPRMYPVFAEHRETMYGIFLSYLKRKRELDDYDFADRTRRIIHSIVTKSLSLQRVSHLYVDEVQDNLLIDVFLLRLLCGNSDGLFWAGDTAQTISAGSSFRFNDLKAFLHRLQRARLPQESTPMRVREPRMFFLSVNYRSHAGIVDCAHSIVEIVTKYWADSIDPLPRERGKAPGAIPIFYTDIYPEFIREGHFLTRNSSLHGKIELGAHQCILVRDDKAREKLRTEVGQNRFQNLGLVLTLYDSKGLEFNDVFLYNFFHDSLVENSWRLILNDVSYDEADQSRIRAPKFDKTRHATLCAELKGLYVAVTRARNNLRIADESFIGEPMRALWESRGHILSCKPGQESTDFARPSNEEEWTIRGKVFFENHRWELAKQCYEKAGKKQAASVADAYLQRERARRIPSEGRGKARDLAFKSAAKAFETCSQNVNDDLTKNKYLKLSAGCLEEGGDDALHARAAEVYRQGNWRSDALRLYRKLGKFDEIYEIITQSDAATIDQSIRDVTRLFFVSKKEYEKAHRLFDSVEEELEYLEDRGLHDAQVDIFVHHRQNHRKAAELRLSEGRTLEAVDLYLQDTTDELDSMSRAKDIILHNLWQLSPFGVKPVKGEMTKVLERAKKVRPDMMNEMEMVMFRAILDGDRTKLSQLADSFLKRDNQHAALLCYDHYFEHLPSLTDADIQKIVFDLHQFCDYVHTLREFAILDDAVSNPHTGKLFGVQAGEENGTVVLLRPNTVYNSFYSSGTNFGSNGNLELSHEDFLKLLRQCLQYRLKDRVTQQNDICRRSQALKRLCLYHVIFRNCKSSPCDWPHILPNSHWFQHWIKAHLLQIVIYHSISGIQFRKQFRLDQKFWLIKLYEALNPAYHIFGPTLDVRDTTVIAFPKAMNVLIEWVRAVSFELEFQPKFEFLTHAMQAADFAFAYDRKEAEIYMSRCKFVTLPCPPTFQRTIPHYHDVNSLQAMLMSWNYNGSSNPSMGISFICFVLENLIPVNIHVFCSFIERISTYLIVCDRLQYQGNLHGVILPRSWLKAALVNINLDEVPKVSSFWHLLHPLERLIHFLYFPLNTGNFLFKLGPEFFSLETQGFMIRGLFIARICRVLGLLGTNISVGRFRDRILNIFTSLHREVSHQDPVPKILGLYEKYFTARTFKRIYQATCRSMDDAVFDEMLCLQHSEAINAWPRNHDVRDIVYSTHDELVSLLEGLQRSTQTHIEHDIGSPSDEVDEHDDGQELEVDRRITEAESQDMMPDIEIPEGVYADYSEKDTDAASKIQRVWKKFLDRKRDKMKAGQESHARRWFVRYWEALTPRMRSERPRTRLQYYFLGPLPNLQATLDSTQPVLHKAKELHRKGLLDNRVNHEDLDQVGSNLTRVNHAMKMLRHHQDQLRPEGILDSNCDIERLKKQVKEVFDIIHNIRPLVQMPNDLQEALEIVYKAVLKEPKPRISLPTSVAKERLPQLVMENWQDLIEDAHEGI